MTRRFLPAWIVANALGEAIGLGLAGALGAALQPVLDTNPHGLSVAFAATLVALGGLEGLVVGLAQGRVLARALPGLRAGAWARATVLGAVLAWILGVLPPLVAGLVGGAGSAPGDMSAEPGPFVQVALAAAIGALAGPLLAIPQALLLRRRLGAGGFWLAANAAAWALALPIVYAVAGGAPVGLAGAARALAALALAGALAGAVHGPWLARRLRAA